MQGFKMVRKRTYMLAVAVLVTSCVLSAASEDTSSSPETIVKAGVPGGFWQGFIASLSVVVVSELGDKTFFIAAIMAMKHARIVVFAGAISALVFMTILSAAFGSIATYVPRIYTYYISAALFAIFGVKMLRDGWKMDPNEGQEELEEVQSELKRREDQACQTEEVSVRKKVNTESTLQLQEAARSRSPSRAETPTASVRSDREPQGSQGAPSPPSSASEEPIAGPSTTPETLRDEKEETLDMLEQGQADRRRKRNAVLKVVVQAATLTFLAEWGDRSQLATVVLATRENIPGVILGGSIGHALCTGLAVVGGRMIAQKISVRTVTIIGGLVFLAFAVSALFIGPGD